MKKGIIEQTKVKALHSVTMITIFVMTEKHYLKML